MGIRLKIPKSHVRLDSLKKRETLIEGEEKGIVAKAGLIAHGRGEAFDYILGEATPTPALFAIKAAAAALLLAEHPVISVNGNTAALVPGGIVALSEASGAELEVNLFYRTKAREKAIENALLAAGAHRILGVGKNASARIPELFSERRRVDPKGIAIADVVMVPLEDGDRTMALRKMGKFVITIDLNPLSRTSQTANITIVDNLVRAIPLLLRAIEELHGLSRDEMKRTLERFDNQRNLSDTILLMRDRLTALARD